MKVRLDLLLVTKNLATGREKAKSLIKGGQVYVDDKQIFKPSQEFENDCNIKIIGETLKYVGRGGLKLEKAMNLFSINLHDKICADIGASTGGFTDCMLQNGAALVYAVDVGHGQLVEKLKNDKRVVNLEGTNVRDLNDDIINNMLDFVSVDVSFISLRLVLPHLIRFLKDDGKIVTLIKPQFEAGKAFVGKKGVVKSRSVHIAVLENFALLVNDLGLCLENLTYSPIKGSEGNIEYLAFLSKNNYTVNNNNFKLIVNSAFGLLKEN